MQLAKMVGWRLSGLIARCEFTKYTLPMVYMVPLYAYILLAVAHELQTKSLYLWYIVPLSFDVSLHGLLVLKHLRFFFFVDGPKVTFKTLSFFAWKMSD